MGKARAVCRREIVLCGGSARGDGILNQQLPSGKLAGPTFQPSLGSGNRRRCSPRSRISNGSCMHNKWGKPRECCARRKEPRRKANNDGRAAEESREVCRESFEQSRPTLPSSTHTPPGQGGRGLRSPGTEQGFPINGGTY